MRKRINLINLTHKVAISVTIIATLLISFGVKADSIPARPITAVYSLEIGNNHSRATYLSPLTYSGTEFAAAGNWQKVMPFAPEKTMMEFDARVAVYYRLINPGGNAMMQGLDTEFYWGIGVYRCLQKGFTVGISGGPEMSAGALVQLRNSNNPVNVNIAASLATNPYCAWQGKIKRLPISVIWSVRLPVVGAFFMPEYGETFYEIYLGNRKGLVHAAWPGNHFRLNSKLAFRLDFGKTAMEVGYRFITDNYRANNLSMHHNTHAFSIGIIPYGLGRKKDIREIRPF